MAQFAAQGRLKPVFNTSDGIISTVFELKEQNTHHRHHHHNRNKIANAGGGSAPRIPLVGFRHKLRFQLGGSKLFASSSSSSSPSVDKSKRFKVEEGEENLNVGIFYDDEEEDEGELQRDDLSCFRGLVLDISYRPVNVVCWKRAICLEFMEKADVLEYYDQSVNSPSGSFNIPAVLRVPHLLQVVKRRRIKSTLSRKNIFCRDSFTCQYCSSRENLTVDHVLPIARGGEWTWENLVTACAKCNSRKGPKTVEEANMKLIKAPKVPKDYDILAIPLTSSAIRMLKLRKGMPDEWRQYISES